MHGFLVIALAACVGHGSAMPASSKEQSFASMLLATQPAHLQSGTKPAHKHVRASLAGMMDPEEIASFQEWLTSGVRAQETPAPNFESSRAQAPTQSFQHDEAGKQEWLAKKAGKVWSKEKAAAPSFEYSRARAPAATQPFQHDEAAKQEWLAKKAGKVWSKEKAAAPTFESSRARAPVPTQSFQHDEAAKQEWLAKRAGPAWSKDKQAAPFPARASAPKKSNLYVDEIAKQAWMAKRAGNYDEVAQQEWLTRKLAGSEAQ
jgi:hypothetical protein